MIRDALGYAENIPESVQIQVRSKHPQQNIPEPPYQQLQQAELSLTSTLNTLGSSTVASPNSSQAFLQRPELDFNLPLDLSDFDMSPNQSSLQNLTLRPELDFLLPPDPSTFEFGPLSPQPMRPDELLGGPSEAFAQRSESDFTLPTGTFGLGLSNMRPDTLLSSANVGHQASQDFVRRPEFDFKLPSNTLEVSPQPCRRALQVSSNGTAEQHSFSAFPQRSEFDFSLPTNVPKLAFTHPSSKNTLTCNTTLEYEGCEIRDCCGALYYPRCRVVMERRRCRAGGMVYVEERRGKKKYKRPPGCAACCGSEGDMGGLLQGRADESG